MWSRQKKLNNSNPRKSILLVDDDETVLDVYKSVLDNDNQVVEVASNGEEALSLFKDRSFDLVISDIMMPGMDGIQLLSQIKKLDSTIDVIILTGFGDKETYHKAMSCGAAEFINKPICINEFKRVVQNHLSHSESRYILRIKSMLRGLCHRCRRKIYGIRSKIETKENRKN